MFAGNPFAALASFIPSWAMQTYIVAVVLMVASGTLFDIWHKKSARYFFGLWRHAKMRGRRPVSGGEMVSLAVKTALIDGLTSGEFCSTQRRAAHLLAMYGFLAYAISTVIMVFAYPTQDATTPVLLPILWHLGALMICIGGYWFWFFIRVDVAAEGRSSYRLVRADLFVVSLLASATLALLWSFAQSAGSRAWATPLLGLYLIATTVLFGSVPWSKFSHMFYKPAAAFQKRFENANGSRRNLPAPADRPATFGGARRHAQHY